MIENGVASEYSFREATMSDFKVVLPRTTKEWQRDMNIAYQQGRADCLKEAHRFADQESYKEGFKRGIEKGRVDVIDSLRDVFDYDLFKLYSNDDRFISFNNLSLMIRDIIEELREQNNELQGDGNSHRR